MKHAGGQALDALEDLLVQIRKQESLKERKRGVFYQGSSALLHFHEDPTGLFADLRVGKEWARYRVSTTSEQRVFLRKLGSITKSGVDGDAGTGREAGGEMSASDAKS
jgi:hypothetical protein